MKQETFCDEFVNLDLRWPENCKKAVEGCDWCFNLAVRRPPTSLARTPHTSRHLGTRPSNAAPVRLYAVNPQTSRSVPG